jgi:hypothetical protein
MVFGDMLVCPLQRAFIDVKGNHPPCKLLLHQIDGRKAVVTTDVRHHTTAFHLMCYRLQPF